MNEVSEDEKTLRPNTLQVEIEASNKEVHNKSVIPVSGPQDLGQEDKDLVTIEQTSA